MQRCHPLAGPVAVLVATAAYPCAGAPALALDDPRPVDPPAGTQQNAPMPAEQLSESILGVSADLYGRLRRQPGNILFSPYSISQCMAMACAGAKGSTRDQMAAALHWPAHAAALPPAFKRLNDDILSRGSRTFRFEKTQFQLHIANALWLQKGYPFVPDYLRLVKFDFGAAAELADFAKDPDACRRRINDWVEDQTRDKIRNLLAEGAIAADTRCVLANAVYFKAAWLSPFEPDATRDEDFILAGGRMVTVPMMHDRNHLAYAEVDGVQAVELRYDGGDLAMTILSPRVDAGKPSQAALDALENRLSADWLTSVMKKMASTEVILTMPKFRNEASFELSRTLTDLGMTDAFKYPQADFTGISPSRELFISQVVHKTFIDVNEQGTEAAAATAAAMVAMAAPPEKKPEPIIVRLDHPFIYLIRDRVTGAVLFLGRMADPRAQP